MRKDKTRKNRIIKTAAAAAAAALLLTAAFFNGLTVKKYTVTASELEGEKAVRIVLLADLHSHIYGENQKHIVEKIRKQKPDIIALAGDIADDEVPVDGTEMLLRGIRGIAPVYYAAGNHEFWSDNITGIKNLFREYGVAVLESSFETAPINGGKINICGVDDPCVLQSGQEGSSNEYGTLLAPFAELPEGEYNILIAHRPELIEEYKKYGFDLVLSGHSHGGQWRIPFVINGLYAPNQGSFPKYAGGLYKHGDLNHIVSRGLSYNPRLPRIFNPPEIVVIDIIPTNT